MAADSILPFAFESLPVRGALLQMRSSWTRMRRDHYYAPLVAETLGHAAAATGLIAQSLKFDGAITLQIQGSDALPMLVVQCTDQLELRGMASARPDVPGSFRDLVRGAHCAITVDAGERPYQGIVDTEGDSLSSSLMHYFDRSVQVPSHIALVANDDVAGGVLLQQIPGQALDADDWQRLGFLIQTLTTEDFSRDSGLGLIGRLFAEDDVRVQAERPLVFRCRCSRNKVEDVLRMLGEEEARQALDENDEIEVVCEYCGERRRFDAVDVSRLFADNVVSGPGSVH